MKVSLKYGFLGIGMGGTSIANACASIRMKGKNNYKPYKALLVNTNEVDLRKLPNYPNVTKKILRGYEKGVARDIQKGQEAFLEHKEEITKQVKSLFFDRDFVFVCCGLGGGTGTGAVVEAARLLHQHNFAGRFGLILTLPRDNEGRQVLDNTLQRLKIIQKAMRGLGSILLVDNEKLFSEYLRSNPNTNMVEYMKYCNQYVAEILHDVNTVTSNYDPLASYHFDSSELLKLLQSSGCLSIGKCVIPETQVDANEPGSYLHPIKQSVENGVLSDGYDFQEASTCAVSMVASPKGAKRIFTLTTMDIVSKQMQEYAGMLDENPVAIYTSHHTRELSVYTVFAGLRLPKRVSELAESVQRYERKEKEDGVAMALESYQSKEKEEETDLESLLTGVDSIDTKQKIKNDPFDF